MAAKAAAEVMTEDDNRPGESEVETTQTGGKHSRPAEPEDQFEIVEDAGDGAPAKEADTREASLSEDDAGDAPLVGDGSEKGRKASHADRRRRQKDARDRNQRELSELRAKNEALEARLGKVEENSGRHTLQTVESAISAEEKNFRDAEAKVSQAITDVATGKATAEVVTQAMRERDASFIRGQRLMGQKNAMVNAARSESREAASPRETRQPQMPAEVVRRVRDFADKHDWYDPNGGDEASSIILALDRAVAGEGFDPATDDYWRELEKRAARRLPEYFSNEGEANGNGQREIKPERRGPMTSAPGTRSPVSGKVKVKLTPDRKEALIEAGVMDKDGTVTQRDKFTRILKGFAQYDAQSSGARQ